MRLLFSLTYYTPYISGLTLYVKRLGEALVKNGYRVVVLTMNFDKKQNARQIVNGVEVVRANYLTKISKGFISFDWIIKSWQEVRNANVIFINLPQFEGIIPAILGKLFGKKVISIYHCEVVLPPGILNKFINWILNTSNQLSLWLSDEIITYTEDFAKHSKILPLFRSKLKFVYPPILEPKIDKRVQKVLCDKIHLQDGLVIGIAARLAAEKGMEYLFEAIPFCLTNLHSRHSGLDPESIRIPHQVRDDKIKIVIAGSLEPVGEKDYKMKILKLVEKYKDYVVFLGELKEEEMGSFYSLLDVLVLPSINSTEAFGMVQVEAMMMGVPVVATDLPGVRVSIQKTEMGLLVPVKNSQKLAEAIIDVLLNKNKYIKDKESIIKEFSIEKTLDFYEKIIHEK